MERPSLPTEVCEQTIDWLVIGYTPQFGRTYYGNVSLRRDLSNCALVCHAWRPRAQMYLFAFLRISGKGLSHYEAILLKSPILCGFAKELYFYNEYVGQSQGKTTDKTVETASHALRIAHKLPHVYYFVMNRVNMASEHTHLPKYMTALRNINQLYFFSPTPAKLSQIARMIVGLKGLSTLYLRVPIIVDSNPLPLPVPCYATKSSLARLELVIGPGGHSLLDWLVHANSFTTSLQVLQVGMEDPIPQSEVTLAVQGIQSLLDRCREHLKEWYFGAKIGGVNDTFPKSHVAFCFCFLQYANAVSQFSHPRIAHSSDKVRLQGVQSMVWEYIGTGQIHHFKAYH